MKTPTVASKRTTRSSAKDAALAEEELAQNKAQKGPTTRKRKNVQKEPTVARKRMTRSIAKTDDVPPTADSNSEVTEAPTKKMKSATTTTKAPPSTGLLAQVTTKGGHGKPHKSSGKKSSGLSSKRKTSTTKAVLSGQTPAANATNESTIRRLDEVYAKRTFGSSSHSVWEDYDVMLNQVAITTKSSINKFYRIQLIQTSNASWDVFTRWGRVGDVGEHKLWCPTSDLDAAIKMFVKKFKEKTKNHWNDRVDFEHKSGFYDIVELDVTSPAPTLTSHGEIGDDTVPSQLPLPTQKLIQMIFDKDMFKSEIVRLKLDPTRMPLGALSLNQIQKGVDILDDIQAALDGGNPSVANLRTLSAKFYQIIPHAYARHVIPPVLETPQQLEEKYEMLSTLHDIVVAQDVEKTLGHAKPVKQNSLDLKYAELNSQLDLVTPDNPLYKVIQAYIKNTSEQYQSMNVLDIWQVRRSSEDNTFGKFAATSNHRLLWHGTNVAVVAAILKSGLRIMPSSGGRVGKGIYLANMLAKSRQYVRTAHFERQNVGCLFLVEAALGKMNEIHRDNSSLTQPPSGFDSVLAKGTLHPNPEQDQLITLDNQEVRVNVGTPVSCGVSSSFAHDEYLVYQESQQRLRFIITFKL
ncbi:Poly [ADP-ribose] polymerase 3 [Aphanomyces cochlioides]|nr:Poly [ADP-ribose] polymerase 3 [Aphanomyces cochlioides]